MLAASRSTSVLRRRSLDRLDEDSLLSLDGDSSLLRTNDASSQPRCPSCGKTFSRMEHLKRHQLIHTGTVDHVCQTCGKTFNRLDALKRHQTIHAPERGKNNLIPKALTSTAKIRQACKRCSRMKLKCDGQQPCQRCLRAKRHAECHFSRTTFAPPDQTDDVRARNADLRKRRRLQESEAADLDGNVLDGEEAYSLTRSVSGRTQETEAHHAAQLLHQNDRSNSSREMEQTIDTFSVDNAGRDSGQDFHAQTNTELAVHSRPLHETSSALSHPLDLLRHGSASSAQRSIDDSLVSMPRSNGQHASVHFSLNPGTIIEEDIDPRLLDFSNSQRSTSTPGGATFVSDLGSTTGTDDQVVLVDTHSGCIVGDEFNFAGQSNDAGNDPLAFDLGEIPSTDLDWLFSGLSPLNHAFDPILIQAVWPAPTSSAAIHPVLHAAAAGLEAQERESDQLQDLTALDSHPTSSLRILSEAAVSSRDTQSASGSFTPASPPHTLAYPALRQSSSAREVGPREDAADRAYQTRPRRASRQLLPRDVCAPSRRPSVSEDADSSLKRTWPNTYYPAAAGQPYLTTTFEPVTDDVALIEDTCQVPEFNRKSLDSIISICELLPPHDEELVRAVLLSIDIRSYNVMLQLYFEKFHPLFPFLHMPTFEPDRCSPFLLIAICAVGYSFSKMRQATSLSDWLIDIAHRLIRFQCDQNMFHARSISTIQGLFLCCITFGNSANRRLFEHGEALHSALATMIRRSNLLEKKIRPVRGNGEGEDDFWRRWIGYEMAKRTAWVCFVADLELASCWKFSATYSVHELRAELPCPDHIWSSSSASIWASFKIPMPVFLSDLHLDVKRKGALRPTSCFEKKILALSMSDISLSLMHIQNPLVTLPMESALLEFQQQLIDMADKASDSSDIASATYEALLRYVHLGATIPLLKLQDIGGRRGKVEANQALKHIHSIFDADPQKAVQTAIIAGRIVYLTRSMPLQTTCNANMVFYAALALFTIARHPFSKNTATTEGSAARSKRVSVDSTAPVPFTGMSLSNTAFVLKGVGDIVAPMASSRILLRFSSVLTNDISASSQGIARRLGRLLGHMAQSNEQMDE